MADCYRTGGQIASLESAAAWRFGGLRARLKVAVNVLAIVYCWRTWADSRQKKEGAVYPGVLGV